VRFIRELRISGVLGVVQALSDPPDGGAKLTFTYMLVIRALKYCSVRRIVSLFLFHDKIYIP